MLALKFLFVLVVAATVLAQGRQKCRRDSDCSRWCKNSGCGRWDCRNSGGHGQSLGSCWCDRCGGGNGGSGGHGGHHSLGEEFQGTIDKIQEETTTMDSEDYLY